MGERTRNNCTRVKCWVHILSGSFGSFGSAVEKFLWRAEFIYLAARLARQWMKERGIIVCTLIVGFIYLVARLARQWIKERGIIDMRVKA